MSYLRRLWELPAALVVLVLLILFLLYFAVGATCEYCYREVRMRLKLLDNWREILRSAWSVKLNILAIILACGEVVLPLMVGWFPQHVMILLSVVAVGGSTYFRLFYQPKLHK